MKIRRQVQKKIYVFNLVKISSENADFVEIGNHYIPLPVNCLEINRTINKAVLVGTQKIPEAYRVTMYLCKYTKTHCETCKSPLHFINLDHESLFFNTWMGAVHTKLDLHQFRNFSVILTFSRYSNCRELNNINKPPHFRHTFAKSEVHAWYACWITTYCLNTTNIFECTCYRWHTNSWKLVRDLRSMRSKQSNAGKYPKHNLLMQSLLAPCTLNFYTSQFNHYCSRKPLLERGWKERRDNSFLHEPCVTSACRGVLQTPIWG